MRLIDADALVKAFERQKLGEHSFVERMFADGVYAVIENFPTVDAVEVVYCEDCKYYSRSGFCLNGNITGNCDCDLEKEPNGYCDWGERRDGD